MTIREALRAAETTLQDVRIASFEVDARILLAHALGDRLSRIPTRLSETIEQDTLDTYRALLERRATRVPLAHITGETEFMGIPLKCDGRALVPRPDTETLVRAVLECLPADALLASYTASGPLAEGSLVDPELPSSPLIADIGTGAGGIALALAHFIPKARVVGTDVSLEALELAAENAALNGLRDRVVFLEGGELDPLFQDGIADEVDILVSNPPYVPTAHWLSLDPEVAWGDPRVAVDGGADGLDIFRRILARLHELPSLRLAAFEFGLAQEEATTQLLTQYLPGWPTRIHADLSGIPRTITATRPR